MSVVYVSLCVCVCVLCKGVLGCAGGSEVGSLRGGGWCIADYPIACGLQGSLVCGGG